MESVNVFFDVLAKEIDDCVEHFVDMCSISTYKNICLIKSCRDESYSIFMNDYINKIGDGVVDVVGEFTNERMIQRYQKYINRIYIHKGRFCEDSIEEDIKLKALDIDGFIILKYAVHSESYLNVEKYCAKLADGTDADIYAYDVNSAELVKYKNIRKHIYAMEAYCNYAYFLNLKM